MAIGTHKAFLTHNDLWCHLMYNKVRIVSGCLNNAITKTAKDKFYNLLYAGDTARLYDKQQDHSVTGSISLELTLEPIRQVPSFSCLGGLEWTKMTIIGHTKFDQRLRW